MLVGGTVCCVSVVVLEALERWESRACSENKQLLPVEGPCHWPYSSQQQVSHQVPPQPHARTFTHVLHRHTHTHTCKTTEPCARLHTHTDECMCVCVWVKGDLELLTENKEENQEKMQPLRINLTTMLRKNPQPHPRNARKTLFLSFKAVKSVLQKQK